MFTKEPVPRVYIKDCLDFCKGFSFTSATEIIEGNFGKLNFLFEKIISSGGKIENPLFSEINVEDRFDFQYVNNIFYESNLNGFHL